MWQAGWCGVALAVVAASCGGEAKDASSARTDAASDVDVAATKDGAADVAKQSPARVEQELETLPAPRGEALDPRLAEFYARRDPLIDGWASEHFSALAGEQLRELAKCIARPDESSSDRLAQICAAEFECVDLRPDAEVVSRPGAVFIGARADSPSKVIAHRGLDGARAALGELASWFEAAEDTLATFTIVAIELRDDSVITRQLLQIKGRPAGGARQLDAAWVCTWSPLASDDPQSKPRLLRIEVATHTEVRAAESGGVMFAEATDAVFANASTFAEQLRPSLEHWAARIDRSLGLDWIGDEGFALGDADGDQLDDLYVCQPGGLPNRLFLRRADGTLHDVSATASVDFLDASKSALFADFDNDGDQDLAVALDPDVLLLENDGRARFTLRAKLALPSTTSLSAVDYDSDGDLDLYCCASVVPESAQFAPLPFYVANNGRANTLLRNDGKNGERWSFLDVTGASGLDIDNRRFSSAAAWEDYDDDGDLDVFVANQFGRGNLYRNEGGKFVDVAAEAGVDQTAASAGVTWGDYDLDGHVDLYVSGTFSAAGLRVVDQSRFKPEVNQGVRALVRRHARGSSLLRNLGDGKFSEQSEAAGVAMGGHSSGSLFTDFDGDGWLDLFAPNGFVSGVDAEDLASFFWRQVASLTPTPGHVDTRDEYEQGWVASHRLLREGLSWDAREAHRSFWNGGDGRFFDVAALTGLDALDDARAAGRVDWDLDGRSDLWIVGRNSPRVRLFLNRSTSEHRSIEVLLRGSRSNRDGVGARVEVMLRDGRRWIQTLRAGEGRLAQSSKWLHFGLGVEPQVESVRVRWPAPGGATWETFESVGSEGRFVLVEGTARAERWSAADRVNLSTGRAESAATSDRARTWLAARLPLPPLLILASDGEDADARNGIEPPMLIVLWTSSNPTCIAELTEFSRRVEDLNAAGVRIVALSADAVDRRVDTLDVLERLQWDFHAGFASVGALEALDGLQRCVLERQRRAPLPTSFLVDHERYVAAIYKGPVTVDTLLADVARLRAPAAERRDRAAPFAGRWSAAPPSPDWTGLERIYSERGLDGAAAEVAGLRDAGRARSRAGLLNEMGKARADQGKVVEAIAAFEEALANEPEYLEARLNLAYMLHQSGRIPEAIPHYEVALRTDSRHRTALFNLALAFCALGQLERATDELELLGIIDPKAAIELERQIKEYFER